MQQKLTDSIMNWAEFIEALENGLLGKRYSDLDLANRTGLERVNIYKIRTGETKNPQKNTINKLEIGLGIRIDDSDKDNIRFVKVEDVDEIPFDGAVPVTSYPLLSEVYAGEPDKIEIEYHELRENFIYSKKDHRCFALKVNGRSMETTLRDGDAVLVDMDLTPIDGDLVAVKLQNGNQYIKRYYKYNDYVIRLTSDNPEYGVRLIDTKDIVAIHPVVAINFNIRNGERANRIRNIGH